MPTEVQEKVIQKFKENNCQLVSFEKGRKVNYICSRGNEAHRYKNSNLPNKSNKWKILTGRI
jgi:hypothetical protein